MKLFVDATGTTLLRPNLPASGCDCYRRKPTHGSQLALCATYRYHGSITDRDGDTLGLEADHRRHAEIENAIGDLKYGVGLNHLPSGHFPANSAWMDIQIMAHNLARWTARIGLGEQPATTKTLRRHFFSLAGRLTPQGAAPHSAPAPKLDLAEPVQQRSRQTTRPATPILTAPRRLTRPPNCQTASPYLRQAGTSVSPAAISPLISPVAGAAARQTSPWRR